MPIPMKPKVIVISANGRGALDAASDHFSGAHGAHHGGDDRAAALDALVAKNAAKADANRAALATLEEAARHAWLAGDEATLVALRAQIEPLTTKAAALAAKMQPHVDALSSVPWIGVVYPITVDAVDALAALPGVHVVSERDPEAVSADVLANVQHVAGITPTETGYTLAKKLAAHYKNNAFRPL